MGYNRRKSREREFKVKELYKRRIGNVSVDFVHGRWVIEHDGGTMTTTNAARAKIEFNKYVDKQGMHK